MEGRAISNNTYTFAMWAVLGNAKEGKQEEKFLRYTVNNKIFNNVIIFRNDYAPDIIDFAMLANHVGIVSFKYNGNRSTLQ